jgi:DNA-binding NarL/FixJ family response regulator
MALAEWLQPELVVLDMEMPVVTGLQAAEVLRTRQPWLRIIIVSVNDSATWREECRRIGVDVFVAKHRLAGELPEQINRLFAQSGRSGGFKL